MNFCSETNALVDRPITSFVYLQVLDVMTTLAFLANGVTEGNPVVRLLIESTSSPLLALVVTKCVAIALGWYAWTSGRHAALRRANVFFAALVVWNLIATIAGAGK
jgi:hypothetical protein